MNRPGARTKLVVSGRATGNRLASREIATQRVARASATPVFRDSGYRNATGGSGKLYNVGNAGYVWSSTIPTGSGYAHSLGFSYGGVGPQDSYYRAYGRQLRCLQE